MTLGGIGMPDIVIVPASLRPGPKALPQRGISGEAIVAGDVVAKDATGLIMKADANDASPGAPLAVPVGIATCSTPGPNQNILYVPADPNFTLGGPTVPGTPYFLSENPGKICEVADLVSGMKTSLLGFGKAIVAPDTSDFIIQIASSGQTI